MVNPEARNDSDGNAPPEMLHQLLHRALALHRADDWLAAQAMYAQILQQQPDHLDALYLSALAAQQSGQPEQAQLKLEAALQLHPTQAALHIALGNLYRDRQQFDQAQACYQAALGHDPRNTDAFYQSGIAYHELGDLTRAIDAYSDALALEPAHVECLINLGVVSKALGSDKDALQFYQKALELAPENLAALFNLGVLHADAQRFAQAIDIYRRLLGIAPDHAPAVLNLGLAFKCLGKLEAAAEWFQRAVQLLPQSLAAWQNLAATCYELGKFDQAEAYFQHALILAPSDAALCYSLSLVALARGDYAAGWPAYEARWQGAESSIRHRRNFTQPQWLGQDIAGQTILLHAEQGLGDTLQFVRYAALVAQTGARVILECQPPLLRLLHSSLQSVAGIELIVAAGTVVPPFDWHCPLLSLPMAFGTRLETVPSTTPYLSVDTALAQQWASRVQALNLERSLRVGLVWAGDAQRSASALQRFDQRRSLHLSQLHALAGCQAVSFFSLQLGEAALQLAAAPADMRIHDLTVGIEDLADTAALIAQLDLVISVDTAVAHLAAALGKPIWLLSRYDACWRWMRGRDDSPWYPTMRLFRQPSPGDWQTVIERVVTQLEYVGRV